MTMLTLEAESFKVGVKDGRLHLAIENPTNTEDSWENSLTIKEAASELGVSQRSIYNFIHRQHNPLPAKRKGGQYRISKHELIKWDTKES